VEFEIKRAIMMRGAADPHLSLKRSPAFIKSAAPRPAPSPPRGLRAACG